MNERPAVQVGDLDLILGTREVRRHIVDAGNAGLEVHDPHRIAVEHRQAARTGEEGDLGARQVRRDELTPVMRDLVRDRLGGVRLDDGENEEEGECCAQGHSFS